MGPVRVARVCVAPEKRRGDTSGRVCVERFALRRRKRRGGLMLCDETFVQTGCEGSERRGNQPERCLLLPLGDHFSRLYCSC
jgi:hypothetical protein